MTDLRSIPPVATSLRRWEQGPRVDLGHRHRAGRSPVIAFNAPSTEEGTTATIRRGTARVGISENLPAGGWFRNARWHTEREPHYSGGMALNVDPSRLHVTTHRRISIDAGKSDAGNSWSSHPSPRTRTVTTSAVVVRATDGKGRMYFG